MIAIDLSPQKVLQSLPKSRDRSITANDLADALNLTAPQREQLQKFLEKFVKLKMAAVEKQRYYRKQSQALLIGTLRCTRSGFAFVTPDDEPLIGQLSEEALHFEADADRRGGS